MKDVQIRLEKNIVIIQIYVQRSHSKEPKKQVDPIFCNKAIIFASKSSLHMDDL